MITVQKFRSGLLQEFVFNAGSGAGVISLVLTGAGAGSGVSAEVCPGVNQNLTSWFHQPVVRLLSHLPYAFQHFCGIAAMNI